MKRRDFLKSIGLLSLFPFIKQDNFLNKDYKDYDTLNIRKWTTIADSNFRHNKGIYIKMEEDTKIMNCRFDCPVVVEGQKESYFVKNLVYSNKIALTRNGKYPYIEDNCLISG